MSTALCVRPAVPADFDSLLPACVDAFCDEAVSVWVVPDPVLRRNGTWALFDVTLRTTIKAGQLVVACTAAGEPIAASVWEDHERREKSYGPLDADDSVARRLAVVQSATAARRPDVPHIYLASMAARPAHRGRGAGAAMLRHGIEHADGLPIYLEASNARNRKLYVRHGFVDCGEPISLPEGGPALQPMWRA